ncbi:MAG: VCBS repeat-containing protein [Bacteroidales bacterium]|nr:VCBS repeat-containing protein [Bacteroidales bacterium]
MKKLPLNPTIFALLISAMVTHAQIPEFTLIETGVLPESKYNHIAGGCFDMDNDGDMDLIITNSSGAGVMNRPNLLYKNERKGEFQKISSTDYTSRKVKVGFPGPFGDIDNDGDADLMGPNWLGHEYTVYHNDGYGIFNNYEELSQLYGTSSVLFDLNNDSFLDILQFHETGGKVYFNDGTGEFDVSIDLNIPCSSPDAVLHNIALGDADNDGDFDLHIGYTNFSKSSPGSHNEVFENMGDGTFESAAEAFEMEQDSAMTPNANWVDFDNDGDMDLYVLNSFHSNPDLSKPGKLFKNNGDWVFEEEIIEPAEYLDANRISSVWGDLDNDADLDLYITIEKTPFNGHVSPVTHNLLLMNNGDGTFNEITEGTLVEESSHTALMEDFDNDGDLDVLLVRYSWTTSGRNNLCLNEGNDNSWIILSCEGTISNKSAYGTRVVARANLDGSHVMQIREITPIAGHATYPSTRIHFGLGDADRVDTLLLQWPSGDTDMYLGVEANRFYRAIEDSVLELDLGATNYIEYAPVIEIPLMYVGDSATIDLADHFRFVMCDTVPEITGDTLKFSLIDEGDPEILIPNLKGTVLTLKTGGTAGTTVLQVKVTTEGFTSRVDFLEVPVYDSVKQKVNTCSAEVSSYHDAETHYDHAIDGDMNTRWGSDYSDNQWIKITLDTIHSVTKVVIHWEAASARKYKILASKNNLSWDTVYYESSGDGETDIVFFEPIQAKYIQLLGIEGNTQWGFSIWELEIYSTDMYNTACEPTNIVSEKTPDDIICVYPNPLTDQIFIDFNQPLNGELTLKLMDPSGKIILMERIFGNNLSTHKMNLSSFKSGIYIIRIINDEYTLTEKVIKVE